MVYVPSHFDTAELEDVTALVAQVGMGTLITSSRRRGIQASHIPLEFFVGDSDNSVMVGHLARGNEQVRDIDGKTKALAIVQGPHGYISPRWYDHENVPTWDYAAVHFEGPLRPCSDDELKDHLRRLVERFETDQATGEQLYPTPEEMIETYLSDIVGFELDCRTITPAFKLSQDKSDTTVAGVVSALETRRLRDDPDLASLISVHKRKSDPR